eukprot:TRINITY_DN1839_c0_g1_i4.p2 TRINITY_DN1839_c0_g1~~TRINITY_DN1839_c0_g1_i4.p2  ORF type:complete len:127 (-),score=33.45 TRINITY_DN1839_c0_g1_i4:21-401(-)
MRRSITILQSTSSLFFRSITAARVQQLSGTASPDVIARILAVCRANRFDDIQATVAQLEREGFSATQLLGQIFDEVVNAPDMTDGVKATIALEFSDVDKALADGADEFLQLLRLLAKICKAIATAA